MLLQEGSYGIFPFLKQANASCFPRVTVNNIDKNGSKAMQYMYMSLTDFKLHVIYSKLTY